jgi:hypothetical protein
MVHVRYSIRINTNKTLPIVKKELKEILGDIDFNVTRNIGKTVNIQIKTNSTKNANKIKRHVENIGEIELFHIITGKAAY